MARHTRRALLLACLLLAPAPLLGYGSQKDSGDLSPADEKAVANVVLTKEKLTKFETISKAIAADSKLIAVLQKRSDTEDSTLTQSARMLDQQPAAHAILQANGMTAREYTLTGIALMLNGMWVAIKKQNPDAKAPGFVTAANTAFCEQNMAQIRSALQLLKPAE